MILQETGDEFFNALCGKVLGKGMTRVVYELPITNNEWCVKVEEGYDRHFQNNAEWMVWNAAQYVPWAKPWFAPCQWISPNGRVLVMRQTEPLQRKQLPEKVPYFFTDLKLENFGMLNGRIVCHDYGVNMILERGLGKRMIKANWRE